MTLRSIWVWDGDANCVVAYVTTLVLPKKGWIGGIEADRTVKFWKYPA